MFFFEGDKNKKTLLTFLVTVFSIFIVSQWITHNPIKEIDRENANTESWDALEESLAETGDFFEESFEEGESRLEEIKEEYEKDIKQAALVDTTKKYLDDKKQTTTSQDIEADDNASSTEELITF